MADAVQQGAGVAFGYLCNEETAGVLRAQQMLGFWLHGTCTARAQDVHRLRTVGCCAG